MVYHGIPLTSHGGVSIEEWTEQTTEALGTLNISPNRRGVPRASVTLEIPLDEPTPAQLPAVAEESYPYTMRSAYVRRKEPLRRDSMKRREALLKGKEGSRRRQKWENDRLLGNPWAEPPEPQDFEVRPTYPVRATPYYLAPLWDERRAQAKVEAARVARRAPSNEDEASHRVPKDLREKLKRAKGAKGLLQDLEEQVREFVGLWDAKKKQLEQEGLADADSSEDEEIVFVGRNGQMKSPRNPREKLQKDKLIFDSLVDDHGASFGRWLVHSIATYYNLHSWSKTTGNRREAYVGIRDLRAGSASLPDRPLWVMV